MVIEGVDWHVLKELEAFLQSKLDDDKKLEIGQSEKSRSVDMFDSMEFWGVIEIVITDKTSGKVWHRKTIRSTTTRSYSADRESQYHYKVNTEVFDEWFQSPQQ